MGNNGVIFLDDSNYIDAFSYVEEAISEYSITANENVTIKRCFSSGAIPHFIVTGAIVFSSFGDLVAKNIIKNNDSSIDEVAILAENISNIEKQYLDEIKSFSVKKLNTNRNDVIKSIISFRSLENNWDGYGAVPLEVESASNAVSFLNLIDDFVVGLISDISTNPNGTISFLWENNSNERLSLEIGNESMSYYLKLNTLKPQFFNNVNISKSEVLKLSEFVKSL